MMEKFAVDLEKVLDEFEYNEEREENVSAPSIRNAPLPALGIGALRQVPAVRPPAASYRRPSFEPINLADADFAASPPKPSTLNFSLETSVTEQQNEDEVYGFVGSKAQFNNRNFINVDSDLVSVINNDVNIKNQLISESEDGAPKVWPKPHSSITNDEKPDLLEYNNKNVETNKLDVHNQLPDITTSVRSLDHDPNSNEENVIPSSLDLISTTSGHITTENGEKFEKTCNPEFNEKDNLFRPGKGLSENVNKLESTHSDEIHESFKQEESEGDAYSNNSSQDVTENYPSIPLNLNSEEIVNNVCEMSKINKIDSPDIQAQIEHVDSSTKTMCVTEENVKKEDFTDIKDQFLIKVPETVQPIGFNCDSGSDVSEGELEDFLKDLEASFETDKKEVSEHEENLKQVEVEISESTETDGKVSTAKSCSITTNEPNFIKDISSCASNASSSNEEVDKFPKNIAQYDHNSHTYVISQNNQITENITNISPKHESLISQSQDFDKSSSSRPQISENESSSEGSLESPNQDLDTDKAEDETLDEDQCETKEKSLHVVGDQNDIEKIQTNPFCNTNPFEVSDMSSQEGTKDIESTNPFDEEDSGYVSEKMENKRKSTNPFEENDDYISIGNSLSESPYSAKLETPPEKLIVTNSKPQDKKSRHKVNCKPDNLASSSVSLTEGQKESDKTVVGETDPKNSSKIEVDTHEVSLIEENSIGDSLPSCSTGCDQQETFLNPDISAKMIPIKAAVESPSSENVDEAGIPAEEDRPLRPNSLELPRKITVDANVPQSPPQSPNAGQLAREFGPEDRRLGKIPPFWVPDTDANSCMQCQQKFTVIKRRHHCRACGQVLCNKCCGLKARLEYMNFAEARVCQPCFTILEALNECGASSPLGRQPNPNNPMEYCSTIPPLQQAAGALHQPPPSVMVPVGVLKREGWLCSRQGLLTAPLYK